MREDLKNILPYDSYDFASKARLNTNENPYEISDIIAEDISKAVFDVVKNANRYPKDNHIELRRAVADFLKFQTNVKFDISQILCANGSNEMMRDIFNAFGGPKAKCLTFTPSYSMYPQYCRDSFTKLITVNRNADLDDVDSLFDIDLESFIKTVREQKPDIVVLANPNNPTGNLTDANVLQNLIEETLNANSDAVFVADEAYIDFAKTISAATLLEKYSNLIVVRTLSKAFSLAGVRLGYAIANAKIIDILRVVRLPYNLSCVTQAVAITALKHQKQMLKRVDELVDRREELFKWLKDFDYCGQKFIVIKSASNFIQVGFPNPDMHADMPQKLVKWLFDNYSVLVRAVGNKGFFRVTVGKEDEIKLFKEALCSFVKQQG